MLPYLLWILTVASSVGICQLLDFYERKRRNRWLDDDGYGGGDDPHFPWPVEPEPKNDDELTPA